MHIAAAAAPRRPAPELSIDQMVTFMVLRQSFTIFLKLDNHCFAKFEHAFLSHHPSSAELCELV